jgi:hypothetical protein
VVPAKLVTLSVIPAQAGIQLVTFLMTWIPACAGMTDAMYDQKITIIYFKNQSLLIVFIDFTRN